MDYLRASASMPFLSKIVEIDGNLYLDGGIADSIPLNAAFNLGYDKNIVVQTRPEGYRKKAAKFVWLTKLVYRKFPKFIAAFTNRPAIYNQELDNIKNLAEQGKIFVIKPSRFINIKHAETNPEIIKAMYNLGRDDAKKQLAALKIFLAK